MLFKTIFHIWTWIENLLIHSNKLVPIYNGKFQTFHNIRQSIKLFWKDFNISRKWRHVCRRYMVESPCMQLKCKHIRKIFQKFIFSRLLYFLWSDSYVQIWESKGRLQMRDKYYYPLNELAHDIFSMKEGIKYRMLWVVWQS